MTHCIWITIILCFNVYCSLSSVLNTHIRMESLLKRESLKKLKRSPGSQLHEVMIAIHQPNMDYIEKTAVERSTPGNPLYQQWLTFEEVGNLIKNEVAVVAVEQWLLENDAKITSKTIRSEYIKTTAPLSTWEHMLNTEFYEWEDSSDDTDVRNFHLAEHYSIPVTLQQHINAILNTAQAPPVISKHYKISGKEGLVKTNLRVDISEKPRIAHDSLQASLKVTVSFLDSFYKISSNQGSSQLSQSVFETSSESFSQSDLTTFQNKYNLVKQAALAPYGFATTAQCSTSSGGTPSCSEGNLDIQYIMGVAQNVASIYWYVGGSNPFYNWIYAVANDPNPPQSNSVSWGSIEQLNAKSTLDNFNTEAIKLASMGVTVLVSSGDDGVANTGCDCNTGAAITVNNCACNADSSSSALYTAWTGAAWTGFGYFPSFPATCPFVTAVGATMGPGGATPTTTSEEIACQSQLGGVITTGGGFSTHYAQPSWQKTAVNNYFSQLSGSSIPTSGYNRNGRGYPDISLVGVNYQVVIAGALYNLYGTSCSAPVMAAMVSLLNTERQSSGLSSIGFLNPTLYSSNSTGYFNDVVSGMNKCCSNPAQSTCCSAGFQAAPGWDPVTGWGSMSFVNFAHVFNSSASYVPDTDDTSSPTPALSSTIVAIIIIVLVASSALLGIGVFVWYSCFRSRPQAAGATNLAQFTAIPAPQGQQGAWSCPVCTLHNPASAPACSACGTSRRQL